MSARPYAAQMQRVLGSLAARVDPRCIRFWRSASGGPTAGPSSSSSPATRGCAAASTRTPSRAPAAFITESPQRCALGLVGRKGRDFFARRGFDVAFEQIGLFQKLSFEHAQDDRADARSTLFIEGDVDRVVLVYNEFKSVMSQRVVVDQVLPIPREDVRATGRRRRRRRSAVTDRLPVRAGAAADLRSAAAAVHRGAGLPRAARIERRVLRGADDGDGHGHQELGGHDRQPDAVHEQSAPGGDHQGDHRGRFGRPGTCRRPRPEGRLGRATSDGRPQRRQVFRTTEIKTHG